MATFELVKEQTRTFGQNSYLEVSRKRLTENDDATEFLLITRGFFSAEGEKRWTKFVTVPDDAETRRWLAEAIGAI